MTHPSRATLFEPPWQHGTAYGMPIAGGCEVWRVDLDTVEGVQAALRGRGPLDAPELARASRFAFERDRSRFVAARLALRHILGATLGRAPAALVIDALPRHRPRLVGVAGLDFNLSHSGGLALVAVASAAPLGIDVETWRSVPDAAALAARLFTANEQAALRGLAGAEVDRAFLTCWTRKEAVLKSTGVGLSADPRSFEAGATPEPQPLYLRPPGVDGQPGLGVPLVVESFAVGSAGIGAIALPQGAQVSGWRDGVPA